MHSCNIDEADSIESSEIVSNNSLFPNGYNLTTGGKTFRSTTESKKRVSNGVVEYFKDKKLQRFEGIVIDNRDISKYVRPLKT